MFMIAWRINTHVVHISNLARTPNILLAARSAGLEHKAPYNKFFLTDMHS